MNKQLSALSDTTMKAGKGASDRFRRGNAYVMMVEEGATLIQTGA